jgi:hypothetical protein
MAATRGKVRYDDLCPVVGGRTIADDLVSFSDVHPPVVEGEAVRTVQARGDRERIATPIRIKANDSA